MKNDSRDGEGELSREEVCKTVNYTFMSVYLATAVR